MKKTINKLIVNIRVLKETLTNPPQEFFDKSTKRIRFLVYSIRSIYILFAIFILVVTKGNLVVSALAALLLLFLITLAQAYVNIVAKNSILGNLGDEESKAVYEVTIKLITIVISIIMSLIVVFSFGPETFTTLDENVGSYFTRINPIKKGWGFVVFISVIIPITLIFTNYHKFHNNLKLKDKFINEAIIGSINKNKYNLALKDFIKKYKELHYKRIFIIVISLFLLSWKNLEYQLVSCLNITNYNYSSFDYHTGFIGFIWMLTIFPLFIVQTWIEKFIFYFEIKDIVSDPKYILPLVSSGWSAAFKEIGGYPKSLSVTVGAFLTTFCGIFYISGKARDETEYYANKLNGKNPSEPDTITKRIVWPISTEIDNGVNKALDKILPSVEELDKAEMAKAMERRREIQKKIIEDAEIKE